MDPWEPQEMRFLSDFVMTNEEGLWLLKPEDSFGDKTHSGPGRAPKVFEDL